MVTPPSGPTAGRATSRCRRTGISMDEARTLKASTLSRLRSSTSLSAGACTPRTSTRRASTAAMRTRPRRIPEDGSSSTMSSVPTTLTSAEAPASPLRARLARPSRRTTAAPSSKVTPAVVTRTRYLSLITRSYGSDAVSTSWTRRWSTTTSTSSEGRSGPRAAVATRRSSPRRCRAATACSAVRRPRGVRRQAAEACAAARIPISARTRRFSRRANPGSRPAPATAPGPAATGCSGRSRSPRGRRRRRGPGRRRARRPRAGAPILRL